MFKSKLSLTGIVSQRKDRKISHIHFWKTFIGFQDSHLDAILHPMGLAFLTRSFKKKG